MRAQAHAPINLELAKDKDDPLRDFHAQYLVTRVNQVGSNRFSFQDHLRHLSKEVKPRCRNKC